MILRTLIILLVYVGTTPIVNSQTINEINNDLDIPDSLIYDQELRIYKDRGIYDKSELIRIFKNDSSIWEILFYEHWLPVNDQSPIKIDVTQMTIQKDPNYFWQELMINNIEHLPKMDHIRYKL